MAQQAADIDFTMMQKEKLNFKLYGGRRTFEAKLLQNTWSGIFIAYGKSIEGLFIVYS